MFENENYPEGDWRRYSTMQADADRRLEQQRLDAIRGQTILAELESKAAAQQQRKDAAETARYEGSIKARLRDYCNGASETFERAWAAIVAAGAVGEAAKFIWTGGRPSDESGI